MHRADGGWRQCGCSVKRIHPMREVSAFPSHTNKVVKSLEVIERKISEFERYANIEIPEFLKIGILIRQAEEGPMRTHLIVNSHRLKTFQNIKMEVTNIKQAQSAVMSRSGDAMGKDQRVLPKALARNWTPKATAKERAMIGAVAT